MRYCTKIRETGAWDGNFTALGPVSEAALPFDMDRYEAHQMQILYSKCESN
jgi:hypothetical protein